MSSVIEITTGSVTTSGAGSLDAAAFYRANLKAKLAPLHEAERDPLSKIISIGSAEVTPSGSSLTNKKWVQKRNEFPEGSLIKLNVRAMSVKLRFSVRNVNLYLRARGTAPLRELGIVCPVDAASTRSRIYIIGRFDILSPDEVKELGLHLANNGSDESMTYETMAESVIFEDTVREKGLAAPPTVKTVAVEGRDGKKKIIPKLRMARRIGLPS